MNYIQEYKNIHDKNPEYGASSVEYLSEACLIIDYIKPKTVLDYGCGKGTLIKVLSSIYPDIEFYGYDPAIEGRDIMPISTADLVINTDVLEHIPESDLEDVVNKISSISQNAFFVLHHALARQILSNGENAHCTVKPQIWYYEIFKKFYNTPYPLPCKEESLVWSAIITFSPTVDFLRSWQTMIKKNYPVITINRTKFIPFPIGKLISLFIPKKTNRIRFLEKYVKSYKGDR